MLTEKEKEVLQAIIDYIEVNEYIPSVREICEVVGLKSTSTVHEYLINLEDKGYIERKEKSPRAMRVLRYWPLAYQVNCLRVKSGAYFILKSKNMQIKLYIMEGKINLLITVQVFSK